MMKALSSSALLRAKRGNPSLQRRKMDCRVATLLAMTMLSAASAHAQTKAPGMMSNDKPVDVSSDTLEVVQNEHIAIFTGNVIATQGEIKMRSDKMIVHYVNNSDANTDKTPGAPKAAKQPKPAKGDKGDDSQAQGIKQIDASGHVIFTNPTDVAKGDFATYMVEAQTLDLTGKVILTRDQNILNGTHMHYDMATARSVLTAGNQQVSDTGAPVKGTGRVHGVFVTSHDKDKAPAKSKASTAAPTPAPEASQQAE